LTYDFKLSCTLPPSPEAIYDAWLDSAVHSAMPGGAAVVGKNVGEPCSAWDGYISGSTQDLTAGKRIVQTWRTTEFDDADPDSRIVVELEPIKSGTRLTLSHTGAPDGQTTYEKSGWRDYYLRR
jgi:activator of HSP90 ATPase